MEAKESQNEYSKRTSNLDQCCLNTFLATSGSSRMTKLKRRLIRSFLSTRPVDSRHLVKYDLCGSQLILPSSHPLPMYQKIHPKYQRNVGTAAQTIAEKYPQSSIVDIGANVGDSAAIMRSVSSVPILCIEGDPFYSDLLRINTHEWPEVVLVHAFVASASDSAKQYAMKSAHGTGRLISVESATRATPTVPLVDLLKEHSPFLSTCKLLKLDTDGLDTLLLRGCREFLVKNAPAIIFEYDPSLFAEHDSQGDEIFQYLTSLDYGPAVIYDNFGNLVTTVEVASSETMLDLCRYLKTQRVPYYDILVFSNADRSLVSRVRDLETAG